MRASTLLPVLATALLVLAGSGRGAEIPRDRYLRYLPLARPRAVQQTPASAALHLYGDRDDPGYRDTDPADGIDDRRHEVLMQLAVRFAPYLVQNTSDFPTNFDAYIENAETFPLAIDTWDITGPEPELVGTEAVDFARLDAAPCPGDAPDAAGNEDCRLLEVLDRFAPQGTAAFSSGDDRVRDRPLLFHVLFFDFPGEGPENWRTAYRPEYERTPVERRASFPHAFVHPFLKDVVGDGGEGGYELVFQYWFFYPNNDSGMNHEGDWEHLNVIVSPRSRVEAPLPAEVVEDILAGRIPATDDAADPLVIRRLDYYFHHSVMTLDFSSPNVYVPRREWERDVQSRPHRRFQEREIWKDIRRLAYVDDAERTVNTHPLGYIGADNKGFDQLLAPPGGKNRNPHGTFPFPGRYTNVGPGGTNDQISLSVDPRDHWKKRKAGRVTDGPEFRRGSVLGLADPARLRIVPDWERVIDLVRTDARARRDWSWLVLPVRFGYPATESPFAGVLENFDTGNVAVVGPSHNPGWNETGAAPGFFAYDPHTLPSIFPLQVQDGFRNDLGFLNGALVIGSLPPLDFASRIATYPFRLALGRRDPVFYPQDGLPFRFVGISSGVSYQILDDDFDALAINAKQYDEFLLQLVFHLVLNGSDSTTVATRADESVDPSVGPFIQVPFYIGRRFASENLVRNVRSTIGLDFEFNNVPPYRYRAALNMWEYAGSLRYSLTTSRLQPFVKAGYGWAWYRLEDVRANGVSFTDAESDWIRPAHIWPNVWHVGAGLELVPWRRSGKFLDGAEIAFRLEYARFRQDLGLDLSGVPLKDLALAFGSLSELPLNDRVTRHDFIAGMTLSF